MPYKYALFLDDERTIEKASKWANFSEDFVWHVVRSYDAFVAEITRCGLPQFISFDHDLADEHYALGAPSHYKEFDYSKCKEKTGMCCAQWLVEYCMDKDLPLPAWQVHSLNPCGRDNINGLLENFKKFQAAKAADEPMPVL